MQPIFSRIGKAFTSRLDRACCFKPIFLKDSARECSRLEWMHPHFRNRGVLAELWPVLRADHSNFHLEEPISPAMKAFLLKHNKEFRSCSKKLNPLNSRKGPRFRLNDPKILSREELSAVCWEEAQR